MHFHSNQVSLQGKSMQSILSKDQLSQVSPIIFVNLGRGEHRHPRPCDTYSSRPPWRRNFSIKATLSFDRARLGTLESNRTPRSNGIGLPGGLGLLGKKKVGLSRGLGLLDPNRVGLFRGLGLLGPNPVGLVRGLGLGSCS